MSIQEAAAREEFYGNMIWIVDGNTDNITIELRGTNYILLKVPQHFWYSARVPVFIHIENSLYEIKHHLGRKYVLAEKVETHVLLEEYFGNILDSPNLQP